MAHGGLESLAGGPAPGARPLGAPSDGLDAAGLGLGLGAGLDALLDEFADSAGPHSFGPPSLIEYEIESFWKASEKSQGRAQNRFEGPGGGEGRLDGEKKVTGGGSRTAGAAWPQHPAPGTPSPTSSAAAARHMATLADLGSPSSPVSGPPPAAPASTASQPSLPAPKGIGISQYRQRRWEGHIWARSNTEEGGLKGRQLHLGYYPSMEDAAKAYDRAAIFLRGRKGVKTNYPLDTYADDPVLLELESAPRDRFLDILRSGCGASRDTIEKMNKARDHKEAKRKQKQLMRERVEALKRLNKLGADLHFVDIQINGDGPAAAPAPPGLQPGTPVAADYSAFPADLPAPPPPPLDPALQAQLRALQQQAALPPRSQGF